MSIELIPENKDFSLALRVETLEKVVKQAVRIFDEIDNMGEREQELIPVLTLGEDFIDKKLSPEDVTTGLGL